MPPFASFATLVDNFPDVIFRLDRDLRYLYINPAIERFTGKRPEEYIGRDRVSMPEAHWDDWRTACRKAFDEGVEQCFEFTFSGKRGTEYYQIRLVPERSADGGIESLLGITYDVTERRLAEDASRKSNEQLRLVLEAGQVAVWDWDIARQKIWWDDRLHAFYGMKPGEFDGRLETFAAKCHPDDRDRVARLVEVAVRDKTPYRAEMRILRPDGDVRWIWTNGQVIAEADGKATRMLGATIDITDMRQAEAERSQVEEALRESEARLKFTIEAASDGYWDWNIKTGYCYLSPRWKAILGYEDHEIENHIDAWKALLHPDDRDHSLERINAHFSGQESHYRSEFRMRHKDGSWRHILSRGRAHFDDKGQPIFMTGTHTDLTQQKNVEAELERRVQERTEQLKKSQEALLQSQKLEAIGRLAGGVAHDFNNLLTGILGVSEDVKAAMPKDSALAGELDEVIKASQRAFQLTRQLLTFSRRQVVQAQVLDVNAVIEDFHKLLSRVIGEDVTLHLALGTTVPVSADPGQLGQVLMNLLVNARDAMPRGGRISLATRSEQTTGDGRLSPGLYTVLEVSDTGTGMSQDVQSHIFEPFFTTKQHGTGLGLATVYGIVKQSGGEIFVRSAPGQGSVFTIYLPQASAPLNERAAAQPPIATIGSETLLVVEDEDIVRRVVTKRLARAGYRVLEASNGQQADQVAAEAPHIDMIVTDVVMPGMNGVEVVSRVRQRHPEARVLFMSGYPDEIITHHGILLKGIDFIEKSDLSKRLLPRVRDILDRQPSLDSGRA